MKEAREARGGLYTITIVIVLCFYSYSTHSSFTNFPFRLSCEAHQCNIDRFSSLSQESYIFFQTL